MQTGIAIDLTHRRTPGPVSKRQASMFNLHCPDLPCGRQQPSAETKRNDVEARSAAGCDEPVASLMMDAPSRDYKLWLKDHRARQTDLVRTEQKRMAKAARLLAHYRVSMLRLGLKPLDRDQIEDRGQELRTMFDAARQIRDTPQLRSDFEQSLIQRAS